MDRTAGSFDSFSAAIDRAIGRIGEFLSPAARAGMDTVTGALEGAEGKKSTDAETKATVDKLNRMFGKPGEIFNGGGTTNIQKTPGPMSRSRFDETLATSKLGSSVDHADWMRQGTQATTTSTVTNNNDVGNDHRTQTASVTVNATGLAEVGALVKQHVQSGLSSMGASIVKGQTASTGASTAP